MQEPFVLFSECDLPAAAVTRTQQVVYWNRAAAETFGLQPSDAGQACWTLFQGHTDGGARWCQQDCPVTRQAGDGRPVPSKTLRLRGHDSSGLRMNVTTIPYPESLPNPHGISLIHLFHGELPSSDRSPDTLQIALLGPVQVRRPDGTLVEGPLWRRAKVRGLLAILALHRGWVVPRDYLLDILWPELDRAQGLANLNTTCYYLRRCLEPDLRNSADSRFVHQADGNYFLTNWVGIELDLEKLENGIRRASLCRSTDQAIGLLTEALALVRGPFLQDLWQLCDWSTLDSHRYEDLHRDGLLMLAQCYERDGKYQNARRIYSDVLASDPCNEAAARQMVALLGREGRYSEARQACRNLCAALYSEFGIEPTTETVRICREATRQGCNAACDATPAC